MAALILIMLISILGGKTFSPSDWHNQFKVGLGLDLSSGTQVVLKAATPNGAPPSASEMQAAVGVLLNRVNGTGNSGAEVETQGSDQITVTVPGKAATSIIDLISTTAYLTFRPVLLIEPYTGTPTVTTPKAKATATPSATPSGTATGTAKATVSPTPAVSSTPSSTASAKASTSDVSAQLASPSATPTTSATTGATAKASATSTAKATTTPTASASPSASSTASAAPTTYGDASAVSAATMKLFDKLVCKPGPNANTVDDSWKSTVPGYTEDESPWDTLSAQNVSCDSDARAAPPSAR
jgi:preprotein translocase subunit SecD